MKSSLLILSLLVSLIGSVAAKIHLTDTANRWRMYEEYGMIGEGGYFNETIYFGHDTVIRGKTYKISLSTVSNSAYSHGYFRDDTVADEVWGIADNLATMFIPDTVEHLIYKGSWQIGDSAMMYEGMLNIIGIDSTKIDGEQYKVFYARFQGKQSNVPVTIVEGIGFFK